MYTLIYNEKSWKMDSATQTVEHKHQFIIRGTIQKELTLFPERPKNWNFVPVLLYSGSALSFFLMSHSTVEINGLYESRHL